MFQETIHYAADADVRAEPRHARTKATDSAHHQIDLYTGLGCFVERLDDFLVHQRVHLGDDASGESLARMGGFSLDQV